MPVDMISTWLVLWGRPESYTILETDCMEVSDLCSSPVKNVNQEEQNR